MKQIFNGKKQPSTTTTTTSGSTTTTTTGSGSSFNWNSLTSQSPTLYNGTGCGSTILVENKSFTNLNTGVVNGNCVQVNGDCNYIFRGCYFGPSIRKGVSVFNYSGTCVIEDCLFASNEAAVEFQDSTGNLQIHNCECINPWGHSKCKGQFVQYAGGITTSNSYITNCRIENFRGEGSTEDWISMFGATGSVSNYIRVAGNYARGGGFSNSGGGFIAGDGDGQYILFENNKLFDPGNYILAAAGGGDIIIRNNMGYQSDNEIQNIAMYAYITNASSFCNNITIQNNGMLLENSGNYYCYCTPYCGNVTGVDESQGNPTVGWQQTNYITTLAALAFPTTLITFVNADILWQIRQESQQFFTSGEATSGGCYDGDPTFHRPVAVSEPNKSVSTTSTTVSSAGSSSSNGFHYNWVFVSGPTTPTLVNATSATLTVNNMTVNGVYRIRLELTDDDGAGMADWTEITKI